MEVLPKNCSCCAHVLKARGKGSAVQFYCWHPSERAALGRRIMCELLRLDGCPLEREAKKEAVHF